jgi:hypothetical protein
MNARKLTFVLAVTALTLSLIACGGGGSSPTPPASVSVALSATPPTSLATSATLSLTANVSNDSANKGVTWTVTCGSTSSGACGAFSPTSTASGAATTYTAPSAVPSGNTVTLTATSVTDTTKTATATITITSTAPAITVTLSGTPPTSLVIGTTASFTATVANDSANKGVTWTVTCGSSGACGGFSPTSTASGSPTTYTAPAAVPTNNTVTITATSVTDTTKSASATVTITAQAAILPNGTYVFHWSGYDSNGPMFFAGAFTVSGGSITGGEQDFSDSKNGYSNALTSASLASAGTGNSNIVITLQTANTNIGVSGVETLHGSVISTSRVLITEYDTFGTGSGSIDAQTSAAAPSGGYAFAISGWDLTTPISPLVIGGIINFSGTSLNTSSSVFDYNDGGIVGQAQTFSSGSITAPDSYGRVTISLSPTSQPQFALTGYIIGTNQIQLVESQTDTLSDDLGGMALGQGNNAGNFSASSVANATYVYGSQGVDVNGLTSVAGTFVFGPSGALSGILALNDFSNFVTGNITSGSYTVDSTGRVTLSSVVSSSFSGDTFTFQLYLDGNGNALELGVDNLQATAGPAYLQTATSADFEGAYGLVGSGFLNATNEPSWGAVGPVTVASDSLNGYTDYNAQGINPTATVTLTGTESSSTAALTITGLNAVSFTSSNGYAYYPIDNYRVVAIEIDGNQIGIVNFEQVGH